LQKIIQLETTLQDRGLNIGFISLNILFTSSLFMDFTGVKSFFRLIMRASLSFGRYGPGSAVSPET
jgi:hypothetical protein